jgi:hypothetical protein
VALIMSSPLRRMQGEGFEVTIVIFISHLEIKVFFENKEVACVANTIDKTNNPSDRYDRLQGRTPSPPGDAARALSVIVSPIGSLSVIAAFTGPHR